MNLFITLGISLGLTLVLELLFALLCGVRSPGSLGLVCLVNLLTNPIVVLVYSLLELSPTLMLIAKIILEAGAIAVEAAYYAKYSSIPHPIRFSLCANVFSYGTGFVLSKLL